MILKSHIQNIEAKINAQGLIITALLYYNHAIK